MTNLKDSASKSSFQKQNTNSSYNNNIYQSQFNKNVLLIILGILKHVFFKDENIVQLKGSLYSSAQNLY